MPEWSDRVHLAIYRTVIVAAGLAGAYHEPVLKATDPEAGMSLIVEQLKYAQEHPLNEPELTIKEVDWLKQFTVCNMSSTPEDEDAVFGRVANWLCGNILDNKSSRDAMAWRFANDLGRARYCRRRRNSGQKCPLELVAEGYGTSTHADAHLVVWELMQVFFIFQVLADEYRLPYRLDDGGSLQSRPLAVLPGSYVFPPKCRVPENTLRPRPQHSHRGWPAQELPYESWLGDYKKRPRPSISVLLRWIHDRGGEPNSYVWDPLADFSTPPLQYKFFEYFLRRHCRVRFDNDAFRETGEWNTFAYRELYLFANDHVGGKFTREQPRVSNLTTRSESREAGVMEDGDFADGSEGLTSYDPPPALFYKELQYFFY